MKARIAFLFIFSISAVLLLCHSAYAKPSKVRKSVPSRTASLVIDAETGVILHQENANAYRYPASLTKLMTLYLTFEALKTGKLTLNSPLRVSTAAAAQPRLSLCLQAGDTITAREAILSIVVRSANDAAVVLAEAVGGSEWQFAHMMTQKARKLGMEHTTFENASGLFDPNQKTTAVDLAKLAIALQRNFPEYYDLFSRTSFVFRGQVYHTHNRVTEQYPGAEGLKTGFVNASGFNLATSAMRNGKRLIGVVLGGRTASARDSKMMHLLDQAFAKADDEAESYAANDTGAATLATVSGAVEEPAVSTPVKAEARRQQWKLVQASYPVQETRASTPKKSTRTAKKVRRHASSGVPKPVLKPLKKSASLDNRKQL